MLDKENHLSGGPGAQLSGQEPGCHPWEGDAYIGAPLCPGFFPRASILVEEMAQEEGNSPTRERKLELGPLEGAVGGRGGIPKTCAPWQSRLERLAAGRLASRGLGEPQAAIETPETTDTARPTKV